jgi:hypothetical protein
MQPAGPKRMLILGASLPLGLLLGVLTALIANAARAGECQGGTHRNCDYEISLVMPAKAGIQKKSASDWIPAFAGMTTKGRPYRGSSELPIRNSSTPRAH